MNEHEFRMGTSPNVDFAGIGDRAYNPAAFVSAHPRKFDGLLRTIEADKNRGGLWADMALAELAILTRKSFEFESETVPFGGTKFKVVCR